MIDTLLPPANYNAVEEVEKRIAKARASGLKPIALHTHRLVERPLLATVDGLEDLLQQVTFPDDNQEFARRFVKCHVRADLDREEHLSYLAIPGITTMLPVVIASIGAWDRHRSFKLGRPNTYVGTMTKPGYDILAYQCRLAKGICHKELHLNPNIGFYFDPYVCLEPFGRGDMVMLNLPHFPTGVVATKDWLQRLCEYCSERYIRIFNDAAYGKHAEPDEYLSLADVAVYFPDLEWAEAFSTTKVSGSHVGHTGAMVGTATFMHDISVIMERTGVGFFSNTMSGIVDFYENAEHSITALRNKYGGRRRILVDILTTAGFEIPIIPRAGFHVLVNCPKRAFRQDIGSAIAFNNKMIELTGIVGLPVESYIRYSVCAEDVVALSKDLLKAFNSAEVMY